MANRKLNGSLFHFEGGNFIISHLFQCLFPHKYCQNLLPFALSECQDYGTLNSADRKITYPSFTGYCDSKIGPGWFRFDGAAGKRMASSCPPIWKCGALATGWLSGGHPSVADGQVNRKVCFNWVNSGCYQWSTNIQVKNCGSYYVYYLSGTPACPLRYCGSDQTHATLPSQNLSF